MDLDITSDRLSVDPIRAAATIRWVVNAECLAANVARLRRDRQLTQAALAEKAGLSRVALGKIERAAVVPRARTVADLAEALEVPIVSWLRRLRRLRVRFRARARIRGREQILAEVGHWLRAYAELEADLAERRPFRFIGRPEERGVSTAFRGHRQEDEDRSRPLAWPAVMSGVGDQEPILDICGLLDGNGVKLLLLENQRDSFFGLSVSADDNGPAVVVNTWDRISVERWIFTAAHELGHLLHHPAERREYTDLPEQTEREADMFASHFLMPEPAFAKEWDETRGHTLLTRVLKVKRIFRVGYKTVLYRLVQSGRQTADVWRSFQRQEYQHFGKTLRNTKEPLALTRTEFAWQWSRSGEPERLSPHDFVEDRLAWLVRNALEREHISLGRAAEILGLAREEMRSRMAQWAA